MKTTRRTFLQKGWQLGAAGLFVPTILKSQLSDPGFVSSLSLPAAESACDTCSGNLLFAWHCENPDVTLGTPCGCSVGDTTATVESGAELVNTQYQDGSYSAHIPTANDRFTFSWDNSTSRIVNVTDGSPTTAGTIDLWMYWNTIVTIDLMRLYVDTSNQLILKIDDTNKYVIFRHKAGSTDVTGRTTLAAFDTGEWYHVKVKWDSTAHSGEYIRVTCDTSTGETNSAGNGTDALGTWAGTSGELQFGEFEGYGGDLYLDNIKIYDSWQ